MNQNSFLAQKLIGRHHSSEVDVYQIEMPLRFYEQRPDLGDQLIKECAEIMSQVWLPKFSLEKNLFEKDLLVLFFENEKLVGFYSASFFNSYEGLACLYCSDAMILPQFQEKGLLSTAYAITIAWATKQKNFTTKDCILMPSGSTGCFRFFENSSLFLGVNYSSSPFADCKNVSNALSQDFVLTQISSASIIRNAWRKQDGFPQGWRMGDALKYGFPEDVDYNNGDVFIRCYQMMNQADAELALKIQKSISQTELKSQYATWRKKEV